MRRTVTSAGDSVWDYARVRFPWLANAQVERDSGLWWRLTDGEVAVLEAQP